MSKLTQAKFYRMPLHERYTAYCGHESNMATHSEAKRPGLSLTAQTRLHNNWRLALDGWAEVCLPRN